MDDMKRRVSEAAVKWMLADNYDDLGKACDEMQTCRHLYETAMSSGTWLVWDKKTAGITSFSDAEMAWTNLGGENVSRK